MFVQAMSNNSVYWSEFVNILDIRFHELLYIMDKYNDGSMSGSVAACILGTVRVCARLFFFLYFYIFCVILCVHRE